MAKCVDQYVEDWDRMTRGHNRLFAVSDGWEGAIPTVTYKVENRWFNDAWRAILSATDDPFVLSLEADVIPQDKRWANKMMKNYREGFLRHGVAWRPSLKRDGKCYEMCCTLGKRSDWLRALEAADSFDMNLYTYVGNPYFYRHDDIDIFEVVHADNERYTAGETRESLAYAAPA